MISINKQGNAIVIEFTDNDKYLFNGKIEVAPNELIVVVDQSDMVTFKRASNGDVLFSQLVDDIQIAGSPVNKDTIIDQFAIIGFTSGCGGGEPGAVSSVNGQTGDVIITPASLNVYTRAEVDADINAETTERQKQDSALGGMIAAETAARERAVAAKQDTLVSGTNIKTVNGQSLLGNGNIDITSGGTITVDSALSTTSENPVQNKVITNALNGKQDAGDYALKSEIPDTSDLATKTELAGKQDALTAGAGIKIADNTIRTVNNVLQAKIIPQVTGFIFNTISVDNAGNPSIVYAQISNTKDQDIQFEPNTSNPSTPTVYIKLSDNIVRKTVADQTYATKQKLAGKLDTATYNSEKASFETKENAAATYQPKGDYATTAQLNGKQDALVSRTNIKTINGESILGEGDITVSGGGTVDDALSNTSENPVQNKVLTDILQGNSVKLGKSASAAAGGVSIGANANSNSNNSVVIGSGSTSSGLSGVAIGDEASDSGGVAIGKSSKNFGGGVVIGQNSKAYTSSVILGDNITDVTGHQIIIGYGNPMGNIITLGMDSTIYWYVKNNSKKTYIRKSDGTYIDVEDSVMTSEEKSKLSNTPTFWTGTQTEYDSIQDKDENTYYFIKEG